jgi:hypothetical protein
MVWYTPRPRKKDKKYKLKAKVSDEWRSLQRSHYPVGFGEGLAGWEGVSFSSFFLVFVFLFLFWRVDGK